MAAAVAAVGAQRGVFRLQLLGWDSWPLLASARVRSVGELGRMLASEWMDGMYPGGPFWRPLTSLSFALDQWLLGDAPIGRHLIDVGLFAALAALVAATIAALGGRTLGAAIGGLLVALHPAASEVVTFPARRAELLWIACTFVAWLAVRAPARAGRPAWFAGLAAACALAAKETGIVAVALLTAVIWCERRNLRESLRVAAPSLALTALLLLGRFLVLHELGGHHPETVQLDAFVVPLRGALAPTMLGASKPTLAVLASLGGIFCVLALVVVRQPAARIAAAGVLLTALMGLLAGRSESWYAFAPTVFVALLAGLLAGAAEVRPRHRLLARAPAVLLGLGVLASTPLIVPRPEMARASTACARFLARLDQALAEPAREVRLARFPTEVHAVRAGAPTRSVPVLAAYSLVGRQRWLRARNGDLPPATFRYAGEDEPTPSGAIDVVLERFTIVLDLALEKPARTGTDG